MSLFRGALALPPRALLLHNRRAADVSSDHLISVNLEGFYRTGASEAAGARFLGFAAAEAEGHPTVRDLSTRRLSAGLPRSTHLRPDGASEISALPYPPGLRSLPLVMQLSVTSKSGGAPSAACTVFTGMPFFDISS